MPRLITVVLPIAAFTASAYLTNKLNQESEIKIIMAAGTSHWRIVRPILIFGLITGGVILRKHNEQDCIKTMEDWWTEIKYGSKRDQLSFNYCAWKNKLKFNYMDGDCRDNSYFYLEKHTGKK